MKNTIWYTENFIYECTINWKYKAVNDTGEVLQNGYDFSFLDYMDIEADKVAAAQAYLEKQKRSSVIDYENVKFAKAILKHLEGVTN